MKSPTRFRLTYSITRPFGIKTTVILIAAYLAGMIGLLVFNFITQAKRLVCVTTTKPNYDPSSCDATPLGFFQTYYTRPQNESSIGTVGTFPWQTNAFGDGSPGIIDYSILALNWSANALACTMYEQSFVLHLESQSSTVAACWYCGSYLRILCTAVDSERTGIPASSRLAYRPILAQFDQLALDAISVVNTAFANSTIEAIRFDYHTTIPGLELGVTPFNDTLVNVALGTTLGYVPIRNTSSNTVLAGIATESVTLGTYIQGVMADDLQSAVQAGAARTLNVNYSCRACENEYKSVLEIFAILIGNTFGVLSTLFFFATMLAEALTTKKEENPAIPLDQTMPIAYYQSAPPPGGFYGHLAGPQSMPMPSPSGIHSQQPLYSPQSVVGKP